MPHSSNKNRYFGLWSWAQTSYNFALFFPSKRNLWICNIWNDTRQWNIINNPTLPEETIVQHSCTWNNIPEYSNAYGLNCIPFARVWTRNTQRCQTFQHTQMYACLFGLDKCDQEHAIQVHPHQHKMQAKLCGLHCFLLCTTFCYGQCR
jgi:hypothetical protein